MNKTAVTTLLMGALILLVGCKHNKTDDSAPTGPAPVAPPSVSEINTAKLNEATVPQAVQSAFGKEHPSAAIDKISLRSTSTGMSFYQITYISQGQPGVASYFGNGAKAP